MIGIRNTGGRSLLVNVLIPKDIVPETIGAGQSTECSLTGTVEFRVRNSNQPVPVRLPTYQFTATRPAAAVQAAEIVRQ